ncbi:energy transducer TonB [Duganella guangzhouensis]|uniref:energy transducer TonB n=1 Tax=Duganella guangzhouensis TaxID=2666084 RepID=UPI001E64A945|nr:energy transducer TonB [Duganella guangzhouensis]
MQSLVVFAQDDIPYTPKFARPQQKAEALLDNCNKPEWPRASLRNGHTGKVTLRFTIAPDGRLLKQEVLQSTGDPALDEAAMKGLSACRFIPGSINGKPVQSQAMMQYVWTLE